MPRRSIAAILMAGVLFLGAPATLLAQGEHGRRAGAELLVMIGDLRRLATEHLSDQHRTGILHRLAGGLAALPLLLRLADQERSRVQPPLDGAGLRTLLARGDYGALGEQLARLSERHPLASDRFNAARPSAADLEEAAAAHKAYCAACHDHPYLRTERPPMNLFQQARETPFAEFLARMLVGVRGDRVTGVENPFSDRELANLIAYYRSE